MAKRKSSGEVKSLEDRLGQFAFMRRAREKNRKEEEATKRAFDDTEEWTGGSVSVSGCTVVMEGGSGATVPTGRMSFQSFNPQTEKIQRDLESESVLLQRIRDCGAEFRREMGSGAEISDLEMAKRLGAVGVKVSAPNEKQSEKRGKKKKHFHGEENKREAGQREGNHQSKKQKTGGKPSKSKGFWDKPKRKQSQQKNLKRKHQK